MIEKLGIFSSRTWNIIFIVLVLLLIALDLGSLLSKEWVISSSWTGGILRVTSGSNSGQHYADLDCSVDCIFSKLQIGGIVYILFGLISLVFMLIWLTALVYFTKGTEILVGWKKYVVLISAIVSQWIGIITWGAVVRTGFNSSGHRSATGPALAVSIAVINPIAAFLFTLALKKREVIEMPNMDSVRVEGRYKWSDAKTPEEIDNKN